MKSTKGTKTVSTFAEKKAEATAAVEGMHRKLDEQIATGSDWMEHLTFMSRLRSYSARNGLLMWSQWEARKEARRAVRALEIMFFTGPVSPLLPELSAPAGFSTWSDMGGKINKGEKALSVLAPVLVKDEKDLDAAGKPKKKLIGFVLKSRTFDISQVDGVDAPPAAVKLLTGEGPEGAWNGLVRLAESNGFTVEVGEVPGAANGYCSYVQKLIMIETRNEGAQQAKTLAHEIGHMLLHGPDDVPVGMPSNVREVEAESVAYTVMNILGLETDDYSLGYVGGWSGGDGALIGSTVERVINTSARVIGFLETGELPGLKSSGKYEFVTEMLEVA